MVEAIDIRELELSILQAAAEGLEKLSDNDVQVSVNPDDMSILVVWRGESYVLELLEYADHEKVGATKQ